MKKTIMLNYYRAGKPIGQTRKEIYENTGELHCPNCGDKQNVWSGEGSDYYVGETHYCLTCEYRFCVPTLMKLDENDPLEMEILRKLRA